MNNLMQLSKSNRHNNDLTAFKVLEATDNSITIRLPWGKIEMLQLLGNPYPAGTWVDAHVSTNSCNGRINSYTIRVIGETPAAFIPQDPAAEYVLS